MNSVLDSERERANAVMAGDWGRLDVLLDDDLVYVHATGLRHNKAQLMAYLRGGPRFLMVDLIKPQLEARGDGVLVLGELHLRLQRTPDSAPLEARSWVSQFWVRATNGEARWRLRLLQSTRMETPVGG